MTQLQFVSGAGTRFQPEELSGACGDTAGPLRLQLARAATSLPTGWARLSAPAAAAASSTSSSTMGFPSPNSAVLAQQVAT